MRHRGHKKAVAAVAHAILVTAYHLVAHQTTYHELGADYYAADMPSGCAAERQGYRVTLEPAA